MTDFGLYLRLGLEHISDLNAYDHMLFVICLCALYKLNQWKEVLILITAFTVGHSITLILSVIDVLNIPSNLIETLIPITIFVTAIYNLPKSRKDILPGWLNFHYLMALIFGLIHGMGFANYLKVLLGESNEIFIPLLSFNLGIEVGQIMVVLIYFAIYSLLKFILKFKHREWVVFISGAIAGLSLIMILGL